VLRGLLLPEEMQAKMIESLRPTGKTIEFFYKKLQVLFRPFRDSLKEHESRHNVLIFN
jgi:hypothetical protein